MPDEFLGNGIGRKFISLQKRAAAEEQNYLHSHPLPVSGIVLPS
jgi:hypothetical protein